MILGLSMVSYNNGTEPVSVTILNWRLDVCFICTRLTVSAESEYFQRIDG